MNPRRRNWWLRASVAAALVAILVWKVDWPATGRTLSRLSAGGVAALLALAYGLTVVSCLKWQLFLRARGSRVPLHRLVRLYIIGYFFNNFAPGTMGGDLARGMALGREIGNHSDSLGTVFLERFTGMIALVALGVGAAAFNPRLVASPRLAAFILLMGAALIGMILLLVHAPLQGLLRRLAARRPDSRGGRFAGRFLDVVFYFRSAPGVLLGGMGLSLLFHALTVVNVAVACRALHLPFHWTDLAVLVPMALLIGGIPVSVNALGIQEGAFVYFLGLAGLDAADAMSIALVMRAKTIVLALAGGLLLVLRRETPHPPAAARLGALLVMAGLLAGGCRRAPAAGVETVRLPVRGASLAADWHRPAAPAQGAVVVLLHGSVRPGRRLCLYEELSRRLCAAGYHVFNVDQRAYGDSPDPQSVRTADDLPFVPDAVAVCRDVRRLAGRCPEGIVLVGHSFGGGVAVAAGRLSPLVTRIVSISPGRRMTERFFAPGAANGLAYVQKRKSADMELAAPLPLDVVAPLLRTYNVEQFRGAVFDKPLLLIEGGDEPAEDLAFSRAWAASLSGPVTHLVIPGASHYFGTAVVERDGIDAWQVVDAAALDRLVSGIDKWIRTGHAETP